MKLDRLLLCFGVGHGVVHLVTFWKVGCNHGSKSYKQARNSCGAVVARRSLCRERDPLDYHGSRRRRVGSALVGHLAAAGFGAVLVAHLSLKT